MGINLLGVDIAAEIHNAMSAGLPALVLTKDAPGARTPGSLTSGQAMTPTSYNCKGFVDTYTEDEIAGTSIQKSDHKILIIGDSIDSEAVPEPGDVITEVATSDKFTIQKDGVIRDPAAATYLCHAR